MTDRSSRPHSMPTRTPPAVVKRIVKARWRRRLGPVQIAAELDAVISAAEGGGSCRDMVTQLAAVSSALDRAGFATISSAMKDCIADPEGTNRKDDITAEEPEKLFLALA